MEVTIKVNKVDLNDWGSTAPIFEELITKIKPKHIIEVGTWKGASAIHMASLVKKHTLDCKITCVDTWLGALEFHLDPITPRDLKLVDGYPSVYYQFLYNIREKGHDDIITAFPNTSSIAAWYFKAKNIKADLIYVDGSHEYPDVISDIHSYLPLLNDGGVLFGDDHTKEWPGVVQAYKEACEIYHAIPVVIRNNYWVLQKPTS